MNKRIPMSLLLMALIILILGGLAIMIMIGPFQIRDILIDFTVFVFALVIISILGIIGAAFLGIYISHRVFSSQGFSSFEEEMLKMKWDVRHIRKKVDELAEKDSD